MTPVDRIQEARKSLREAEREIAAALKGNNSRARAPFVRMLHEVRGMLNPSFPYASQAGQDQVIDQIFKGKRGGTFVDVGAYDGISGSNSLFFEKWRDWTGVMVEPVAMQRERAEQQRSAPCLPYAVAGENGSASFMAVTEGYTQMSGLVDQYDSSMLDRVRADPRHEEQMITVETRTLSAILTEASIANPDFISLDIEGGELAALEAFPFEEKRLLFKEFYGENVSRLEDAKNSMIALLVSVFPPSEDIQVSNVEGRVKDRTECIEKFKRKYRTDLEESGDDYLIQDHITDLVGLRIICLYEDMVPKVRKKLEEIFEVFDVTDKISEIEGTENSFGYKGLHLDVKLKPSRRKLPEYVRFSETRFEIQLRTVIQDSWSALDHKIKYKKSIPRQLKRRINTLAALFELADHEFVAIRDKTLEEANRPDSDYEAISKETPAENDSKRKKKPKLSALNVFSFLKIAKHFFPQSEFDDSEVDDFVQLILDTCPEISRGTFNLYLKVNISDAKRLVNELLSIEVNPAEHPLPIIRISLYLGDSKAFKEIIGPSTRDRIDALRSEASDK